MEHKLLDLKIWVLLNHIHSIMKMLIKKCQSIWYCTDNLYLSLISVERIHTRHSMTWGERCFLIMTMILFSLETCPATLLWLINVDMSHVLYSSDGRLRLRKQMKPLWDREWAEGPTVTSARIYECVCMCLCAKRKVEASIQVAWITVEFSSSCLIQVVRDKSY